MKAEISCSGEVLAPEFSDVTATVKACLGFLRDQGVVDEKFLAEFELAAVEALNNAVEHGAHPEGQPHYFRARLSLRRQELELRVSDPSGFTGWSNRAKLPDDPLAEGGRGHFLLEKLTDELWHETENGEHVLAFRKRLPPGQHGYLPGRADHTMAEMTDELVASYELISTLLGLSEFLAMSPEIEIFTEGALGRLCEVTGADFAYVRFLSGKDLALLKMAGNALRPPPASVPSTGSGLESRVFDSGEEITLATGYALAPDDPLQGAMDSGFITPIPFKDHRRGLLVMGRREPAPFFAAGQLKVARLISEYLGIVVMMAELQERRLAEERALQDLKIAAEIQMSLMPRQIAPVKGLDIHGRCDAARQAGGDYFDIVISADGSVLLLIADVMGKGVPAALLAAMLRTNFRGALEAGDTDPGQILTRINKLMCADLVQLGMFITVGCVRISPSRESVRYASAGHCAGLIETAGESGAFVDLEEGMMPVGIMDDTTYTSHEVALPSRARMLLYTDGLSEARAPDGEFFEVDNLKAALRNSRQKGCRESLDQLLARIEAFTGGAEPTDDRTAILVARTT